MCGFMIILIQIPKCKFSFSVVEFYFVPVGESASVKLKIKLTAVCVRIDTGAFKLLHKVAYACVIYFRDTSANA